MSMNEEILNMTMNVMESPPVEHAEMNTSPDSEKCGCSSTQQTQSAATGDGEQTGATEEGGSESAEGPEMLGKIPPEIAMLLVLSGIAGIILPGPIGTPLLLAGGVTIWPKTFQPIEKWFSRKFPAAHREGVYQMKQFMSQIEKRYPTSGK